jgi:VanZ family protein
MGVIFLFSSEGHDVSSSRSDAVIHLIPHASHWSHELLTFITRKLAHSFNYFILGILILNVVRDFIPRTKRAVILSGLFVMLYAMSDEIHQIFVPGRGPLVTDVLIDSVAGVLGIVLFYGLSRLVARRRTTVSADRVI